MVFSFTRFTAFTGTCPRPVMPGPAMHRVFIRMGKCTNGLCITIQPEARRAAVKSLWRWMTNHAHSTWNLPREHSAHHLIGSESVHRGSMGTALRCILTTWSTLAHSRNTATVATVYVFSGERR